MPLVTAEVCCCNVTHAGIFDAATDAPTPDPQTKYRVYVKEGGARTTVQVLSAEGGADQSDTGKKILDLLFEQLK